MDKYEPGKVIVVFNDKAKEKDINAMLERLDLETVNPLSVGTLRTSMFTVTEGEEEEAIEKLNKEKVIRIAERSPLRKLII